MKTNVMRMFLALSTVTLFGSALNAQSYRLTANIPFAFQAGNQTYAPGAYAVRQGSENLPTFANVATGHKTFIVGAYPSLGTGKSAKLVFHCYGPDKCFLSEIWPSITPGVSVPKSKAEKELITNGQPREMALIEVDLRRAD